MAYTSVISLKHKIEDLLHSSDTCLEMLELAHKQVKSLEEIAEKMSWTSMSWLVIEIAEAVRNFEEAIESHVSKLPEESCGDSTHDERDLEREIHSLAEKMKKMEEEYADELYNSSILNEEEEEEEEEDVDHEQKSKVVGLSDRCDDIKRKLVQEGTSFDVFSLVGMPGIGKSTLAKQVFSDLEIVKHFDSQIWVKVGRKCQLKEIPRRILAQLNPDDQILARGDEDVAQYLKGKRFLIVLDDVWDKYMAYRLQPSYRSGRNEMKNPFLDEENGSRILVTTRLMQVDIDGNQLSGDDSMMQLLSEEESWDLLRDKVFGENKSCPFRLEKAGKKIAKKCDGLPLMIVTVANLLTKEKTTPEYWSEIATKQNHQLFMAAYDKISKVLLPSYQYLPRLLQTCFLYLGVFPQNYEIPRTKLINMWNADGFLERNSTSFSYPEAMECLGELVSNSLVMVYQITIETTWSVGETQIKTCGLHSSLWHLSNKEAKKTKFSYVLNSYSDGLEEDIQNQHRLCFHNNVLFGIKDLCSSVEDNCAPTARSLLCYGPYIQYQVPVCFGLKLLTEFDALTLRFYEFPEEVLELVQLRYLALTFNGTLPDSICQLSELKFLIVGRHLSIKSSSRDRSSYLPSEIWNMEKLQHIQVMGTDLLNPCGSSLESLFTLSNVTGHSCTESVLKAIPNLRKLGIRIELAPNDIGKPLSCFDHISHFVFLNSLKCVVVNPEVVAPLAPFSTLPQYLTKLSLSGLGYPWKEMSKIASLSHLSVLKLRNYACRGPVWEVEENGFPSLRSLVIEDTDLIEWNIGHESFKCLGSLSIKDCYKLRRIHGDLNMSLEKIEFVDCDPLGVKQMEKAIHTLGQIGIHSSWNETKKKNRITNYFVPKINYLDGDWSIG